MVKTLLRRNLVVRRDGSGQGQYDGELDSEASSLVEAKSEDSSEGSSDGEDTTEEESSGEEGYSAPRQGEEGYSAPRGERRATQPLGRSRIPELGRRNTQ